jgi:uncharacterized protein YqeY
VAADLKERLNADVKSALKQREKQRLGALRLFLAAIQQQEIDGRVELDDAAITGVLVKAAKQRRESIAQFTEYGRDDLAAQEQFELDVLTEYLPQALSPAEIEAAVAETIDRLSATSIKDMGKVMGALKSQFEGRADMGAVGAIVKARLNP